MSMTSHLWVLIHKHQSEIQALGPFATLGAALIAAGVAGTFGWLQYRIGRDQRHIASSQRDIANMRVWMDLHAKRYEVVQAAGNLMAHALSGKADQRRMQDLQSALLQCRFFFPAHIAAVADEIAEVSFHAAILGSIPSPRPDVLNEAHQAQQKVARLMEQWPAPFSEVMTFRDVE